MADSEQMKGVDSSHGAGKLQVFFKCRASIWFQMITEKKLSKEKKPSGLLITKTSSLAQGVSGARKVF